MRGCVGEGCERVIEQKSVATVRRYVQEDA